MPIGTFRIRGIEEAPVAHRRVAPVGRLGKAWTRGTTALSTHCPLEGVSMEGDDSGTPRSTIAVTGTGTNRPSVRWTHGTPIEKLVIEPSSGRDCNHWAGPRAQPEHHSHAVARSGTQPPEGARRPVPGGTREGKRAFRWPRPHDRRDTQSLRVASSISPAAASRNRHTERCMTGRPRKSA